MNVDLPVTVAAALATITADFEPDAANEVLVAALTCTRTGADPPTAAELDAARGIR